MTDRNSPHQYDVYDPSEFFRLMREVRGYLHTCRADHHGTDAKGRQYAIEAIEKICAEKMELK